MRRHPTPWEICDAVVTCLLVFLLAFAAVLSATFVMHIFGILP